MTETKLVICAVDNLQTTLEAKSMNNSKFLVIAVKTTEGQTIPNGVVDFFSIINSTSKFISELFSYLENPIDRKSHFRHRSQ